MATRVRLSNASTRRVQPVLASTQMCKFGVYRVEVVTHAKANLAHFGKFGQGRLGHFITKNTFLYIKQPSLIICQSCKRREFVCSFIRERCERGECVNATFATFAMRIFVSGSSGHCLIVMVFNQ